MNELLYSAKQLMYKTENYGICYCVFNLKKQKMLFNKTSFNHKDGLDVPSYVIACLNQMVFAIR